MHKNNPIQVGLLITLFVLILALIGGVIFFDQIPNFFKLNRQGGSFQDNASVRTDIEDNIVCKRFTDIDEALKNISIACWLDLTGKNISELPSEVVKLKNLNQITLANNNFTVFPEVITQIPTLIEIDLENNQISEIPTSISKLSSLQTLNLENNNLTTLPSEMVSLTSLHTLILTGNNIGVAEQSAIRDIFATQERDEMVPPLTITF